jgi:hypothetical protein
MTRPNFGLGEFNDDDRQEREPFEAKFKKLKRPIHASKRSKTPERLHGIHRRRRRRMGW